LPPDSPDFLMCAPDYFDVSYVINPWMVGQTGKTDPVWARGQWLALRDRIAREAVIGLVAPQAGVPDLVFTANAGLALGRRVLMSRFKTPERRAEEKFFRAWFANAGFDVREPPSGLSFEGAGDALYDSARDLIWFGHGFRSDAANAPAIAETFDREVAPLQLVDPRFYHLDTCFCPLPNGGVLYYPAAFAPDSLASIEARVPVEQRIAVGEADALHFCCNAVALDGSILVNDASPELQERLRVHGLEPILLPLGEFMKAGGSAKCLTLRL
jgi:N-dimethylarginine dimethylaminohydrolase